MTLVRWRPTKSVSELAKWEDTIDRIFRNDFSFDWDTLLPTRGWAPAVDIYEEGADVVIKAEIPGLTKDDISVEVHDGTLTIKGEKKEEKEEKTKHYYRVERSCGTFERSFTLPDTVDADAIKANFKNGVLELKIPKTEPKKIEGRKIEVLTD